MTIGQTNLYWKVTVLNAKMQDELTTIFDKAIIAMSQAYFIGQLSRVLNNYYPQYIAIDYVYE